jgi:redox-sensitive bicupin YhaK (pirin superfamily)
VQVVRGSVKANGQTLGAGDGAAVSNEPTIDVSAVDETELLLFDLA